MGEVKLFPFDTIRNEQSEFIADVKTAIDGAQCLLAHAPTGLGKTAAALTPALEYALKHKKTVFFLTSRHTQHAIAVETLQAIRNKHGVQFHCTDLIGKRHMCLVPGVSHLRSGEFAEYCRKSREDNACDYYTNTKQQNAFTVRAKALISDLKRQGPQKVQSIVVQSKKCSMCPYEVGLALAKDAHVVIADYYYVFNPTILGSFLARTGKTLDDCIIIVDEGHNLPGRIRELMTERLTSFVLYRAIREARKFNFPELAVLLEKILKILEKLAENLSGEKKVTRDQFQLPLRAIMDLKQLTGDLHFAADIIRAEQKFSMISSVAEFIESWQQQEEGFVRFIETKFKDKKKEITLNYKCLDPSLLTTDVITEAHSVILMSGTLMPTHMYRDLLGFDESTMCKEYKSPFPQENRLNMVIPQTSTRYATRGDAQYKRIADITAEIVNRVPGNSAVFFPSYYLRDEIYRRMANNCLKTTFLETPGLSNQEKQELLEKYKRYHKSGAVLLGVVGGSFGEGVDLPGEFLKAVVVVGLPLTQPNITTKSLIEYYDHKFGRGWDYGYTFPALNKVMQAAGRCIRSHTDKGVIIFLDERYSWGNYLRCFPQYWDMKITGLYKDRIEEFFSLKAPNL